MLANPGLYLHFPWCVKKCPYCDFNSHPLKDDTDLQRYVDCLVTDLRDQTQRWSANNFSSVFLGGGTPSLFNPAQLASIMSELSLDANAEVTMEANPGTTEHADFAGYADLGVNRLSLGAQSFNDKHLNGLGRIHSSAETTNAFEQARASGFNNINLDLMWGLPGQSVAQAMADLDAAITLQPEHLSWYQLTLEPRTEFAARPPIMPVEDVMYEIEQQGLERLARAGFVRYEVSAYSQPGYQCRHNMNYWQFGDYIGVGAGAHGKVSRTVGKSGSTAIMRTSKARQPRLYQQDPLTIVSTPIEQAQLPVEFMINALRLIEGVPFELVSQRTGLDWAAFSQVWQGLVDKEMARNDRCTLTPLGLRFLDTAVEAFLSG